MERERTRDNSIRETLRSRRVTNRIICKPPPGIFLSAVSAIALGNQQQLN